MTRRLDLGVRVAASLAVVVCLWLFVRGLDWGRLGHALGTARIWPLVLAMVLYFAMPLGKAVCWRVMLAPRHDVATSKLLRYTIVAYAASVIAPARAGELLRIWLLKRRHGVSTADAAAVAIAEKLVEAGAMVALLAPLPWLLPGLPSWVVGAIVGCAGVVLGVFVVLYVAVGHPRFRAPSSWFGRFVAGMHVVRSGRRLLTVFALLIGVWVVDIVLVMLVLGALRIDLPVAGAMLILFGMNLTTMAPSTPGSLGAWEVGVLAATHVLGVPDEPALAFALLNHAAQLVPLLIAGPALEWRLLFGRGREVRAVS